MEQFVDIIKDALVVIASFGIIVASYRLWVEKDRKNMIYARIHILGVIDCACFLIFLALGETLLAFVYLILAPFLAHAIAHAAYNDKLPE
ncbi:putative monovalent cation/H+ antiporter subunit G [Methanocaldococcus vulcanius M7]|uniref:Monovalent cation/H+ antiporter subunit G n=1 Tax=Methanocaldococcus vulcanius (strain ATCC 700851 / DSM 12094 / M7) TaxID=579137 RepID=C9RG82_METVM|nr:cation:proton antiporter [Methanocaldococcus vulcanius]ACX72584.1 putative monovalent cation/H+ antiporter subunit G [Methanocaldococcus vulcanius M7]